MENKIKKYRFFATLMILVVGILFIAPDFAEARRGSRSFGGSRKSSSYSKSKSSSSKSKSKSSFGNKRSSSKPQTASQKAASSFGGKRLGSSKDYTKKYGTPRKTTAIPARTTGGPSYVTYGYGGYGSGLMTGYMMGTTSWMWSMPFHRAYYYSRPYYVDNPDGTVGVYPPTFSWSKLIFTFIIITVIVFVIVAIVRNRKKSKNISSGSFS
jgi:hypothetical protein